MRWKLLIITSLVAALVGAGGCLALVYWMRGVAADPLSAPPSLMAALVILPLVIFTLAGIFVYRHTARRRKLQAVATVFLSLILTLAALFAAQIFLNRPAGDRRELPPAPNSVS
ncbi:MAG TPA: hypothetical protein VK363_01195 [Pyrinomonadaceae bacterium]|nr:hypothetical protein [Pyrinomonadaceae bacterium]